MPCYEQAIVKRMCRDQTVRFFFFSSAYSMRCETWKVPVTINSPDKCER